MMPPTRMPDRINLILGAVIAIAVGLLAISGRAIYEEYRYQLEDEADFAPGPPVDLTCRNGRVYRGEQVLPPIVTCL